MSIMIMIMIMMMLPFSAAGAHVGHGDIMLESWNFDTIKNLSIVIALEIHWIFFIHL